MLMQKVPVSVRETFLDYFSQFKGKAVLKFDSAKFFASIDVDKLILQFGAERVEQDYRTLCSLEGDLKRLLKADGVEL